LGNQFEETKKAKKQLGIAGLMVFMFSCFYYYRSTHAFGWFSKTIGVFAFLSGIIFDILILWISWRRSSFWFISAIEAIFGCLWIVLTLPIFLAVSAELARIIRMISIPWFLSDLLEAVAIGSIGFFGWLGSLEKLQNGLRTNLT
jgi:hypothetical protein